MLVSFCRALRHFHIPDVVRADLRKYVLGTHVQAGKRHLPRACETERKCFRWGSVDACLALYRLANRSFWAVCPEQGSTSDDRVRQLETRAVEKFPSEFPSLL